MTVDLHARRKRRRARNRYRMGSRQLGTEIDDVLRQHHRIGPAVKNEYLRSDFRHAARKRIEHAVKARDATHGRAAACEIESTQSAEAIADRRYARFIDFRLLA
jgi:hypothetical protein